MPRRFIHLAMLFWVSLLSSYGPQVAASCAAPANPIEAENCQVGNPSSEWDVSGAGDSSIQGYATQISIDRGQTVFFKVKTNATNYQLDIYRLGYYGGMGARKVDTVLPSAALPQSQPNCLSNAATGLIDCGNWAVSASWVVPANSVSGIYFARLIRNDNGGASHIVFVVRDDTSTSDLLFQTSDTTWQAYNDYGGNSLYTGAPVGRAYKVSYNRPFNTRGNQYSRAWLFGTTYPMVRWIEANGYDVSYSTGVDSDRRGAELLKHAGFLSVGHDEYWSSAQRTNVEAARNAGVHLAFFSGNEVFWKTRWESSIDGSGTPYRTLVSYKETFANAKIDPLPNVWTGTWRDPRFSPPADGGRPENQLTGTIFTMNCCRQDSIKVPEALGKLRFWRNTSVATLAPGQVATLAPGAIGYEADEPLDNGFQPPGLVKLSSTTLNVGSYLLDYGSTYGSGTATHSLTAYRHSSGALVFGAGTIRWPWGLDVNHDFDAATPNVTTTPDIRMQQATVNLLADMGVQPATLQSGLVAATVSTDAIAPSSTISSPTRGSNVPLGSPTTISGTATDSGGGVVGGVEVSVDGLYWQPAVGRATWSYSWIPSGSGNVTIKSRAADDSGNLETPGPGVTVMVGSGTTNPCSGSTLWTATAVAAVAAVADTSAVELGVKFRSDVNGTACGVRFYKGSANTGTHVGKLWSSGGTLLAQATFTGETASGWQQVNFSSPVAITANTVYVASYHAPNGRYAANGGYFTTGVDTPPLHALQNGASGGNGVYLYGAGGFPTNTFNSSNYWVDVVFIAGTAPTLTSIAVTPANPTIRTSATQQFTATGTYSNNSTQGITNEVTWASSNTAVATINSAGLATAGTGIGTTTISATSGTVSGNTSLTVQTALTSIAVTPTKPTIRTSATQQFTATGTYSNHSTQDITSEVTWASSNTAVATINSAGLATAGTSTGTTTISATSGTVSGNTSVQAQAQPPVLCDGLPATIVGTDGNDYLVGTPGNDVIHGRAGNDTIFGVGGDDVICGGPGRDKLYGNSGNHKLFGGAGNDVLKGGRGRDRLFGQSGNDVMDGGSGFDRCDGGSATDKARRCERRTRVP